MIWNGRANPRRAILTVAALLIFGAPIGSFQAARAAELSGGVVRIGIINDQTGPLSDLSGPGSIAAARMAAEDFQKSVPSIKVEIVAADHQNKPDIGVGIVRKWFDVDGVDMVADVSNSAVGLAIQSLARDKNKIAVYSAVATTELNGKQCSRNGLAWLHDSYNLVSGPIRTLVSQGYDTWFFIAADYAFGKNMVLESQRVLAATGGKSLGAVYHPIGTADYSSFDSAGPGVRRQGHRLRQCRRAAGDLDETMERVRHEYGQSKACCRADVHHRCSCHGPRNAKGLTTLTAWYWALNDETRAFAQRFYKLRGAMPTAPQAAVYSGVGHYLKAVAEVGTDATDPVLEKMRSMPVDDFYARGAKIREDGKLVHDFYLVQVKDPSDVKAPWEYYNVLERVPGGDIYSALADSECPLIKRAR